MALSSEDKKKVIGSAIVSSMTANLTLFLISKSLNSLSRDPYNAESDMLLHSC